MVLEELSSLNYVFPVILALIAAFRLCTPLGSKVGYMQQPIAKAAASEYGFSRSQYMTLAFFTIAVITLIATRDDLESKFESGLAYLSIGMFCFFIGSYMFIFQHKKNKFPYLGETLEFVGIISLGIGFFYVVIQIVPNSITLGILYLAFLFALVAVAVYELYINYRFFHPR